MSRSRDKGTRWESRLALWFREHGWPNADRNPMRGANDCGDVRGVLDGDLVIEGKDVQRLDLRAWCDEAEAERVRAGATYAFVALKRSGTVDAGDAYAIMRMRDMNRLLIEIYRLRIAVKKLAS